MAEQRDATPPLSNDPDSELISVVPCQKVTENVSPDISVNESDLKDKKVQDMLSLLDQYGDTEVLPSETYELLGSIPDGYAPLLHQMGGHKYINGKPGFLRQIDKPEYLLKPLQPFPKGNRELNFYEFLQGQDLSKEVLELKKFLPRFYGVRSIAPSTGGDPKPDHFCLEDCTYPFQKASILDMKIGRKVCEPGTDEEKVLRARGKFPAQESIGFMIVGMRVYTVMSDSYKYYNRSYGRTLLDDEHINQGLLNFLDNGTNVRYDILPIIIQKIAEIKNWFAKQTTFKLFATSILLIYEGSQAPEVDSSRVDIRLVDFTHAYLTPEVHNSDPGSLFGIDRVLHHFQLIKDEMP